MAKQTFTVTFNGSDDDANAALVGITKYVKDTYPNYQGAGTITPEGVSVEINFSAECQSQAA